MPVVSALLVSLVSAGALVVLMSAVLGSGNRGVAGVTFTAETHGRGRGDEKKGGAHHLWESYPLDPSKRQGKPSASPSPAPSPSVGPSTSPEPAEEGQVGNGEGDAGVAGTPAISDGTPGAVPIVAVVALLVLGSIAAFVVMQSHSGGSAVSLRRIGAGGLRPPKPSFPKPSFPKPSTPRHRTQRTGLLNPRRALSDYKSFGKGLVVAILIGEIVYLLLQILR
ncbi:MAG: hypothetical protein H0W21_07390 [Actinobacteria bacterium]|nr:hypothetical protein [Actinomycetota bacterium]